MERSVIRKGHPEDDTFVERSHLTDDEEFYLPFLHTITNEKQLVARAVWWEDYYNRLRPHQSLRDRSPYEYLRSKGYTLPESFCRFPSVILDAISANLEEQNESGMSGVAMLEETDGGTRVVLELTGAPHDIAQPAHIHLNSCADIGRVQYPLTFPANGRSETMLEVSLDEILAGLPLAINVHKSAEEASVYVACGDIVMP